MDIQLIKFPAHEDWMICKMCTLATVGLNVKNPPTEEWKHDLLEARHSPIRELHFVFRLIDIPYYVAMHLVRHHVGCQPYVMTQRNDRQKNYDRRKAPQDSPVTMMWSMNADALITIAQKRLCNQASPETRAVVKEMCELVVDKCPEFKGLLKPACEWQGGVCHEIRPCAKAAIRKVMQR